MSDLLSDLAGALRETTEAPATEAARTRARVLASVRSSRSRWLGPTRVLVPLAAAFIGGTAWAAATGQLPAPVEAVLEALHSRATSVAAAPPPRLPTPAPLVLENKADPALASVEVAAAPAPVVEAPVVDEPAAPIASARRSALVPRSTPRPAPAPPLVPSASAPSPTAAPSVTEATPEPAPVDPADALYATAHRLHFVQHDSAAALQAWNAYLRAAPGGRFGVEAAYNRAICLVRLGRTSEAKTALNGFASGAYGGYRRAEAKALLDAMQSSAP